jgi:hypothetical protein
MNTMYVLFKIRKEGTEELQPWGPASSLKVKFSLGNPAPEALEPNGAYNNILTQFVQLGPGVGPQVRRLVEEELQLKDDIIDQFWTLFEDKLSSGSNICSRI